MDTLLLDAQCGCELCPFLSVKLWNDSLPQQRKLHHHCEKHILTWSTFLVFINSTLSPTNTICHSPEDLKCRLKLHIGIKSIKQHMVPLFRPENIVLSTDKSIIQAQTSFLLPQGFSLQGCSCFCFSSLCSWSPAGFLLMFLTHIWSTGRENRGQSHPAPPEVVKPWAPTGSSEMFSSFS